eukprot:15341671-Ditylum_brightwellii.AAC.1
MPLKQFKNAARWKEFWRNHQIKQLKQDNLKDNQMNSTLESTPKIKVKNAGLRTGLTAENTKKIVPKGSENLEKILHRLEATLLEKLLKA